MTLANLFQLAETLIFMVEMKAPNDPGTYSTNMEDRCGKRKILPHEIDDRGELKTKNPPSFSRRIFCSMIIYDVGGSVSLLRLALLRVSCGA